MLRTNEVVIIKISELIKLRDGLLKEASASPTNEGSIYKFGQYDMVNQILYHTGKMEEL